MGIFKQIEAPTRAVLKEVFADKDLRKSIIYKRWLGQGEFANGVAPTTYTDFPLYAVRLRHTQGSEFVGVGDIQVGDQLYMIDGQDIPSGSSLKDVIQDENGVLQAIKSIDNIFGLAVAITIEGSS